MYSATTCSCSYCLKNLWVYPQVWLDPSWRKKILAKSYRSWLWLNKNILLMEGSSKSLLAWQAETFQEWALVPLITGTSQFVSYYFAIIIHLSQLSFSKQEQWAWSLKLCHHDHCCSQFHGRFLTAYFKFGSQTPSPSASISSENLDARSKFFPFLCRRYSFPYRFSSYFLLPCTYASYLGKR